ncbi:MAG: phosphopentomutase [Beijerinckiaceae bacterium]
MSRAIIIVLDSFGIGGAPDAETYGDLGSDTFGHIAKACADGKGNQSGLRSGLLNLPHMDALGLGAAGKLATGTLALGFKAEPSRGLAAAAIEISKGKDTPSGHWEIAGCPVPFEWGYFPDTVPSFPASLVEAIIAKGELPGILGNRHASGTGVIEDFGEESIRSGKPIFYTSVDSVLQIAAHEEHFGLERLYALCKICRKLVDPLSIGRVIARPFLGSTKADFKRTPNRKDFAMPPPANNILDLAADAGRIIVTVGKIGDIFAHRNVGEVRKGKSNDEHITMAIDALKTLPDGGFMFVNLVDFDTDYGHRRDVAGYAAALEAFDRRLPEIERAMQPGDLLILTADHGNDPTWRGTDHTRECVPVLMAGAISRIGTAGRRATLSDIGATVANHLGLPPTPTGTPIL